MAPLFAVLAFAVLIQPTVALNQAKATTSFGVIEGNLLQQSTEFLGIPYAQKPERFAKPKPWSAPYSGGALKAHTYTPQCIQTFSALQPTLSGASEDCLHLNIYTPRSSGDSKLAVMFWIHGGSLTTGSAMTPMFNGSGLVADQQVVYVAINYRLNAFGFSVVRLPDGSTLGNNGFRDQREGMRWVRHNIGAFGGNPASVTIFGESAGGHSTVTHVLSRGSAGLFDRAIAQSPDIFQIETLDDALNHSNTLAKDVGCKDSADLACLLKVNASNLCDAYNTLKSFRAVVDGDIYTDMPMGLIEKEEFNRVPLIIGNNANEGNLFIYPPASPTKPASAAEIKCVFAEAFGQNDEKILDTYMPVDAPGIDNRDMLGDAVSDVLFHCDNMKFVDALAAKGMAPWVYSFRQPATCPLLPIPGVFHASELAYVFGNLDAASLLPNTTCKPSEVDYALSRRMMTLWGDFAKDGVPVQDWPRHTLIDNRVLKLEASTLERYDFETGYRSGQCKALGSLVTEPRAFSHAITGLTTMLPVCQKKARSAIIV